MYDITKRESFDQLGFWIDSIKDSIDNSKSKYAAFILGNKSDLVDGNIGDEEYQREVKEEEAIKFCEVNNLIWGGEHSIKNIEYEELKKLLESYVLKIYDIVGMKKPKKQKVTKVEDYKKKKNNML